MSHVLFSIANPIYRKTIESKSVIMNLDGKAPESGYLVTLRKKLHRMNVTDLNPGWIDWFIRAHLEVLHNHKCYIRTEVIDDQVVLTVDFNCKNKRAAIAFAGDNGQETIIDVLNNCELHVYTLKAEVE